MKKILKVFCLVILQFSLSAAGEISYDFLEDVLKSPDEYPLALVKLTIDKAIDNTIDIEHYLSEIDNMVAEITNLLPEKPTSMDKLNLLKRYLHEPGENGINTRCIVMT